MKPRERYLVLDTWRYIAAVGVVLYHYENHFQPYLPEPSHLLARFAYMVDFFFVLSGFVLMHTYGDKISGWRDYGRYMQKRFARLYPLHFITTLAFLAVGALVYFYAIPVRDPQTFDIKLALPTLTLTHSWGFTSYPGLNFPSWSISSEFFVYFLFPFLAATLVRIRTFPFIMAALGFILIMATFRNGLGMRPWTEATYDFGMLRALPTFMTGMAVYVIVTDLPGLRVSWLFAYSFMAAILALMLLQVHPLILIGSFPIAVALIAIAERSGGKTILAHPICGKLGDASYGIYMLHSIVQIASLVLVRKLGLTSIPELIAVAIAGTIASTIIAVWSYKLFEMPARRYLSKPLAIFDKKTQPTKSPLQPDSSRQAT